jgi:hypothetical protein
MVALEAVGAYAVAEFGPRVIRDVGFQLLPVPPVIPDLVAI